MRDSIKFQQTKFKYSNSGNSGQTFVFFLVTFGVVLLFCGLAIDSSMIYLSKAKLSRALDASVISGVASFGEPPAQVAQAMLAAAMANCSDLGDVNLTPVFTNGPVSTPRGINTNLVYTYTATNGDITQFQAIIQQTPSQYSTLAQANGTIRARTYIMGYATPNFNFFQLSNTAQAQRQPRMVALILDHSASMGTFHPYAGGNGGFTNLPPAVTNFLAQFDTTGDQLAIYSFASSARREMGFTTNFQVLGDIVCNTNLIGVAGNTNPVLNFGGGTAPDDALRMAMEDMVQQQNFSDPAVLKYIVFFTDGVFNTSRTLGSHPGFTNIAYGPTNAVLDHPNGSYPLYMSSVSTSLVSYVNNSYGLTNNGSGNHIYVGLTNLTGSAPTPPFSMNNPASIPRKKTLPGFFTPLDPFQLANVSRYFHQAQWTNPIITTLPSGGGIYFRTNLFVQISPGCVGYKLGGTSGTNILWTNVSHNNAFMVTNIFLNQYEAYCVINPGYTNLPMSVDETYPGYTFVPQDDDANQDQIPDSINGPPYPYTLTWDLTTVVPYVFYPTNFYQIKYQGAGFVTTNKNTGNVLTNGWMFFDVNGPMYYPNYLNTTPTYLYSNLETRGNMNGLRYDSSTNNPWGPIKSGPFTNIGYRLGITIYSNSFSQYTNIGVMNYADDPTSFYLFTNGTFGRISTWANGNCPWANFAASNLAYNARGMGITIYCLGIGAGTANTLLPIMANDPNYSTYIPTQPAGRAYLGSSATNTTEINSLLQQIAGAITAALTQ